MTKLEIIPEAMRVLKLEGTALLECARRLEQEHPSAQFVQAVHLFCQALDRGGKIIVTGVGKSGKIAQKIAATLCSTGSFAVYLHPTEGLHGDVGIVRPEDVILALSYRGNTAEVIQLLPFLKERGLKLIGMGGNSDSKLAGECDAWIDGHVDEEACPHNLVPTSSTTLALALGDTIALTLMQLRGFNSESFAQNHPGGALGKRLNLKVANLMHRGEAVATLDLDAPMDDVVVASTQKPLGGVLIVKGKQLLGIITDGDIRRALSYREKFFQLKAQDIMTRKPITIESSLMAQKALELMENRPSQINVLPVVDAQGNWEGLIRLHDLVKAL